MEDFAKERAALRREEVSRKVTFSDMAAALIAGIAESGSSTAGALSGLTTADGEWYILNRKTIRSYVEFSSDAERMGNLADVFPMIFFLVAALSSLTSMTRMVEDHRAEIGTLKALGFSTLAISVKYIGYALAASLLGGGAGLLIGCTAAAIIATIVIGLSIPVEVEHKSERYLTHEDMAKRTIRIYPSEQREEDASGDLCKGSSNHVQERACSSQSPGGWI